MSWVGWLYLGSAKGPALISVAMNPVSVVDSVLLVLSSHCSSAVMLVGIAP